MSVTHAVASCRRPRPWRRLRRSPRARKQHPANRRLCRHVQRTGGSGRGEGIHLLEMDPATGVLAQRDVVKTAANPSWLALDRTRTHLLLSQ